MVKIIEHLKNNTCQLNFLDDYTSIILLECSFDDKITVIDIACYLIIILV